MRENMGNIIVSHNKLFFPLTDFCLLANQNRTCYSSDEVWLELNGNKAMRVAITKKIRIKHIFSVMFYTKCSPFSIFRRIFAPEIKECIMAGIINTLERQGGYITVGETRTRGEYEQLRRATADGTLMRIRPGVYA